MYLPPFVSRRKDENSLDGRGFVGGGSRTLGAVGKKRSLERHETHDELPLAVGAVVVGVGLEVGECLVVESDATETEGKVGEVGSSTCGGSVGIRVDGLVLGDEHVQAIGA